MDEGSLEMQGTVLTTQFWGYIVMRAARRSRKGITTSVDGKQKKIKRDSEGNS